MGTVTMEPGFLISKGKSIGNDQEMVRSERNSHSKKVGKTKLTIRYLYLKPSEQLYPNRLALQLDELNLGKEISLLFQPL